MNPNAFDLADALPHVVHTHCSVPPPDVSFVYAQHGIKIIKNDKAERFVDAGNGRVGTVVLKGGTKVTASKNVYYDVFCGIVTHQQHSG